MYSNVTLRELEKRLWFPILSSPGEGSAVLPTLPMQTGSTRARKA